MSTAQAHIPSIFERLQSLYLIPEPEEVFAFVEAHPILEGELFKTHNALREFFPQENFRLTRYVDPTGEMDDELEIKIVNPKSKTDLFSRLQAFYDAYWIENSRPVDYLLSVEV